MGWQVNAPRYTPHASQFAYGLKGGCTLLALAACDVISKGIGAWVGDPRAANPDPSSAENVQAIMYRIYQEARQFDLCAPNGAANQGEMLAMAAKIGLPVKDKLLYADNLPNSTWVYFLRRYIAHQTPPYAILAQVANGQALRDVTGGGTDEVGLNYHAICIYGTQTDLSDPTKGGYIVCDGDNPTIAERPVIYSLATLAAARTVSMIAFDYVGKGR